MLTAGLGLWIKDSVRFHSVSVGQDHCLALTNLGSVFAWGAASLGRKAGLDTRSQLLERAMYGMKVPEPEPEA